jgi:hypothetical protein
MSSSRIYPFAKEFVKEDSGNRAHVFTETADGAEHYAASVFMYGATIRGINKGMVVPVWSADGTYSKVQRRGGGKVVIPIGLHRFMYILRSVLLVYGLSWDMCPCCVRCSCRTTSGCSQTTASPESF